LREGGGGARSGGRLKVKGAQAGEEGPCYNREGERAQGSGFREQPFGEGGVRT